MMMFSHSRLILALFEWRNFILALLGHCPPQAKCNMFASLRPSPFCYGDPHEEHKYPSGSCLSSERTEKAHLLKYTVLK